MTTYNFRRFACVAAVAGLACFVPLRPAVAEDQFLTAQLQAAVAELTPAQQAAMFLFLSELKGTAPAAEAKSLSAEEALKQALAAFNEAAESGSFNFDTFFASIAEDFEHPVVGDKKGAVEWLSNMKSMLVRDGKPLISFHADDVEVEEDGDTAEAYPIDIETPLGNFSIGIIAKKEADGVWRVVEVDGL